MFQEVPQPVSQSHQAIPQVSHRQSVQVCRVSVRICQSPSLGRCPLAQKSEKCVLDVQSLVSVIRVSQL